MSTEFPMLATMAGDKFHSFSLLFILRPLEFMGNSVKHPHFIMAITNPTPQKYKIQNGKTAQMYSLLILAKLEQYSIPEQI